MKFTSMLLIFLFPVVSFAFPSPTDKQTILDLLNAKVQRNVLQSGNPVSFDEINCSRTAKSCSLSIRIMIPQDDFFVMKKSYCVVEPVNTLFDILDEKTGDLSEYFLKSIRQCL